MVLSMCKKKPYCGSRIDECLQEEIENINREGILRTISSCCGHGKYKPTIIVENLNSNSRNVFEWYSHAILRRPKRNRFYKKDKQDYYYLNPELIIEEGLRCS